MPGACRHSGPRNRRASPGSAAPVAAGAAHPDRQLRPGAKRRQRVAQLPFPDATALGDVPARRPVGRRRHRYRRHVHWLTFRPPAVWAGADLYDLSMQSLVDSGAAVDEAGVYLLARLSSRYPTVEVRIGDACLTADDTVLFAAVVRALV